MGPNTERKYRAALAASGLLEGSPDQLPPLEEIRAAVCIGLPPAAPAPSSVEPWRGEVEELLDKGLTARAIFDRLRVDPKGRPFRGSYSAVKRAVRRIKRERGPSPEDVPLPIVTVPGTEAQVDFGYAGKLYDPERGVLRRAWVFIMLACHSRHMFVRLVFDQNTETWLELHEQAFAELGGVFETLVPDNTRRAVLRAAFGIDGPTELERSYRELAERWGFRIDPAPPGQPRKRGKVEAAVKYVRSNVLKGRDGQPMDRVQEVLQRWNREVAGERIHGTMGRRPIEVFLQEERPALRPLPPETPERVVWRLAKVHPDSHVTCRGRLFSVPWHLIHEQVWVRACGRSIEVLHHDHPVARHEDCGVRRTTLEEHLPADRRLLRHRSRVFWEAHAGRIGLETLALVREVFDQDGVLSHLRTVQAIVGYLKCYPQVRAEGASRHARKTGDLSYQGIKRILVEGLDLKAATAGIPVASQTPGAVPLSPFGAALAARRPCDCGFGS